MAELAAGFVDLDALFAVPGAEERPSPAAVLYMFADEVLGQAAEFGDGTLQSAIEQAGLGGDLVGAVDLALASKDGALTIERLKAVLPGENRIEASGRLTRGEFGPVFAGPVKLEGAGSGRSPAGPPATATCRDRPRSAISPSPPMPPSATARSSSPTPRAS